MQLQTGIQIGVLKEWDGQRSIVSHGRRRWVIHDDVRWVIEALVSKKASVEDVVVEATNFAGHPILEERVIEIIEEFLKPNGLMLGHTSKVKNRSVDRIQWRVSLHLPKRIGFVERWAQNLFHRKSAAIILVLMLLVRIPTWLQFSWKHLGSNTSLLTSSWAWIFIAIWFASLVCHEFGHVVAARMRGTIVPAIGFGFYWGSPVFYADLNDLWSISPMKRMSVNLAGVYVQDIVISGLYLWNLVAPWGYVQLAAISFDIFSLSNLNPLLKYDGYWILTDLFGTHNL